MDMLFNQDVEMMERALQLAKQARIIAPPNPWVGCVIVKKGKKIAEGYTQAPGNAHAEIVALREAKNQAEKSTVYVTLEPCAHFGRTPPCINALIEAKVARVVIGVEDPNEQVKGQGIAKLREAGIEVTQGILSEPIKESLAPYLYYCQTKLPYCFLKGAASVDGRVAAQDGTSQWISSSEARLDCHQTRAESQAIIIGSRTASVDQPLLTVRDVLQYPPKPPLRVILDSQGKVQPIGPLFDTSLAPTLIVTTANCPQAIKDTWKKYGAEVETVSKSANGVGVDLKQTLFLLGQRGVLQAMIEGGGTILSAFLEAKLVQHFCLYIGGCILGNRGIPLFLMDGITTLKDALKLELKKSAVLGNSVRLDYKLNLDSAVERDKLT